VALQFRLHVELLCRVQVLEFRCSNSSTPDSKWERDGLAQFSMQGHEVIKAEGHEFPRTQRKALLRRFFHILQIEGHGEPMFFSLLLQRESSSTPLCGPIGVDFAWWCQACHQLRQTFDQRRTALLARRSDGVRAASHSR
jgi:hypothetical protein